jgi:antitoxin ParD1/3/4
MNISLPPAMKRWIEAQVAAGWYGNVSEFFRQLVRAE